KKIGTKKMDSSLYLVGISFAILSGIINNFGIILQKKVVNEIRAEVKFGRALIKNPLWLFGLIIQLGIGTIFFLLAQVYIGPALIPGLMASGLIILAFGSVKIIGETLKRDEIIGILLMIGAIFLLGISGLSINISEQNLLDLMFLIRIIIFTSIIIISAIICEILQRKIEKYSGILLSIFSGLMFSLSNFWVSLLLGTIINVFQGIYSLGELILFISSSLILIATNFIGILKIQESFKVAQASNMIPIQQVPIQITSIFIYLLIFLLQPPSIMSIIFLILGIFLILISSFLLGKRQAQLEKIK
ncbi:MAG: hypothetical protein KAX10_00850, partial [Candidatus Lokiarchaeota archaeon]|nr:hypothetical protein [Candidatus Lokiarchaeota archaeon]